MAVRFSDTSTQYITAADVAGLTFPNGDWTLGLCFNPLNPHTAPVGQYLISTAPFGDAGQFNLFFLGSDAGEQPNGLQCHAGSAAIVTTVANTPGWKLYIIQRASGVLSIKRCEILASAPVDGSAVAAISRATSTGSTALTTSLDGTGFKIGARQDLVGGGRFLNQELTRVFKIDGLLTDFEIARLAHGETIIEIGKTPTWRLRMSSVADIADTQELISTSPVPALATGNGITTVAEPAFGFSPSPVLANEIEANKIYQRISGASSIPFSGTYTGTAPASIEIQFYASNGSTILIPWAAVPGATIAGGNWSGTVSVPAGGMYRFAVRSKDSGGTVLGTSTVSTNLWGVGDLLALVGSSTTVQWTDSNSGTGFTAGAKVRRYSASWGTAGTNGAILTLATNYSVDQNVPVGIVEAGVAGTLLSEWSNTAHSSYVSFAAKLAAVGGKLAGVLAHVGSNDAGSGSVTSKASHLAAYRTLISNIRASASQPTLPIFISGCNRRSPGVQDAGFTFAREAEKDLGGDTNVYYAAQTIDLEVSVDDIHLTAAGYQTCIARMQRTVIDVLGTGTFHRGPSIASMQYSGNTAFVDITHIGGTDFTPASAITGFSASDGSGALTISSVVRTNATRITLTFSRAISGTPVVRYLYGTSPISSGGGVFDNSAGVLPLEIETELAATLVADTAPVITGVPVIIGTPTVGVAVSYTPASVTGSPTPARTQQWGIIPGGDIIGATGATYTPVPGNAAGDLTIRQIETNSVNTANATSAGVTVVAASSAPVITGVPVIIGTPTVGVPTSYTPAPVTGSPTPNRTQQWGISVVGIGVVDIVGATGATYTPLAGNAAGDLSIRQIETNSVNTASATSAGVTVVAASATPVITSPPQRLGDTIIAGDTLNFSTCTPGYSAADGWQLLFRLAPLAVGGAVIDLATVQDPDALDQHLCQAVPATTAAWAAGAYSWVSWVVRAGETYTIDQGAITIEPNPRTLAAGYDSRSLAVRTLEDLKAAYSGWTISKGNTRRYRIGDREREFKTAADIIADIRFWEKEVHQEAQAKARATGQPTGNRFYIRHTR